MALLTFSQLIKKILEEEKRSLSPEEIWELAKKNGYDKEVRSKGKTPWNSIGAVLYMDVRDNPSSIFAKTDTRPKRFFLKSQSINEKNDILSNKDIQIDNKKKSYLEKDLHPFMIYYGHNYLKAHLKTINHEKSKKRDFGEWLHPDIVGCYFSFKDWEKEVVDLSSELRNISVKLFSFELKRELNFSNLREAFFQAVSNSSWANEGYLVAANISNNDDFVDELKRLSTSFGIGVIKIDIEEPDSTETLFPAKSKELVDWETINKLATLNQDFRGFLKRVKNDVSSREIRKEEYDSVLEREQLIELMAKKK